MSRAVLEIQFLDLEKGRNLFLDSVWPGLLKYYLSCEKEEKTC